MKQPRPLPTIVFVLSLLLAGTLAAAGQSDAGKQVEPSYDVSLQLIIGSNDASGRTELPAGLANVSRQLKGTFPFSNYRLASTLVGRISNTGAFEYKSVTNIFGDESALTSQTFLEWSVRDFRSRLTTKGTPGFQAEAFRFGARMPVTTGSIRDDSGKPVPTVSYEPIGLTVVKLGLPENDPTLVGTVNLPGANGTIFLVITVKAANM